MAKIILDNIAHTYEPNASNPIFALKEMSLSWADGGRYALLGPVRLWKDNNVKYYEWFSEPISWKSIFR